MADLRIVDPCAPRPYDTAQSLRGLGGTEATVLRIANALSGELDVVIEQATRASSLRLDGVRFRPMDLAVPMGRVIVVINAWKVALRLRRTNPDARICLWLHVHPGRHNRQMGQRLREADIAVICVSRSHAGTLSRFLPVRPRTGFIHNPVSDDLRPDDTPRDRDRLVFASSPHKGLPEVVRIFYEARRVLPGLKLILANPGYLRWPMPLLPTGTLVRGSLTHDEVIAEFRRALCLFYPQSGFAETFGLVIAEANAVGCPALLHGDIGANREIASTPDQCVDAGDLDAILARLIEWRAAPPRIGVRPEFRLSAVASLWLDMVRSGDGALPGVDAVEGQFTAREGAGS
ncbi:glycosyltransferase family 4 protein [Paenirhodobacter populi]|uniref:glycosyltransferase family 4 protein n=1 Tax=Paenirhodobacter populi TaxID=2306993 RepID=UPI0013E3071F|nr:glycosyltransferase family 4 protein [Sinirhodobacter populi]